MLKRTNIYIGWLIFGPIVKLCIPTLYSNRYFQHDLVNDSLWTALGAIRNLVLLNVRNDMCRVA